MNDADQPVGEAPATEPVPPPESSATKPRFRVVRAGWRWSKRGLGLVIALLTALIVSTLTIDLGRFPQLKQQAEQYASRYLEVPMHIGALHAHLRPGKFRLDDVVIEGRHGGKTFFAAKRITIEVSWMSLIARDLIVNVDIDDWEMHVERWPDRTNIPKLTPKPSTQPKKKRPITTTVRYIHAKRGQFTYHDHGTPWSVIAPNLNFSLAKSAPANAYVGIASFNGGTVQIQQFLPMATALTTRFTLEGSQVNLHHIDLDTDGAMTHVSGALDFSRWPEQTYNVSSELDFRRMRELFFARETWAVDGLGRFRGVFQLFKAGGYRLGGEFDSDLAEVNGLAFHDLHGSLVWEPGRFAVTHADADLLGGRTRFTYGIEPIGAPTGATHRFAADYHDLDLRALDRMVDLKGLLLNGTADGQIALAWPSGKSGTHFEGNGETRVKPAPGVALAGAALPAGHTAVLPEPGEFQRMRPLGPLPVGGLLRYHLDADGLMFDDSWVATPATYVGFRGRTNQTASNLPFHVTSRDWQASARLLAAIMTAVGGPTGAVPVNGFGTFDGVMTESFKAPHIAGRFTGEAMRVWDVTWGRAVGDIVLKNSYVDITNGVIGRPTGETIRADGRFSLGYPRKDGDVEINARVQLTQWSLDDLRTAFGLKDWPVQGTVAAADLTLRGRYKAPFGTGRLRIDRGVAWGESFDTTEGDLEFDGRGVNFRRVQMTKGTGVVKADAFIGWDETYSFTATGERIPIESLDNFKFERAPLTGLLKFRADGAARTDAPAYRVHAEIDYLYAGDEGLGPVVGDLAVRNRVLTFEQISAISPRLQVFGSGQMALNERYDSEMTFRFVNSSLDPYLKFFDAGQKLSPYTRAIVSGSVRVSGPLLDVPHLTVAARVEDGTITFLDYELRNEGDIVLTFAENALKIGQFKLVGTGTNLNLRGGLSLTNRTIDLAADGEASLAILQNADFIANGSATLTATASGPLDNPVFSGFADVKNGYLKPRAVRHSFNEINGRIQFDERNINLEGVRARLAAGEVVLNGNVTLAGYAPGEFNLTATGRRMNLLYPTGFSSSVDADLRLTGPYASPLLSGTVTVIKSRYAPDVDPNVGLLGIVVGGIGGGGGSPAAPAAPIESGLPMRFDIRIAAPARSVVVDNRAVGAHIEAGGELLYQGTYDHPALSGRMDIDGGEVNFNGNRIVVRGGSVSFSPPRIDPYFDLQAETSVIAGGQTYIISLGLSGTFDSIRPTITSEPWLSETDVITLLLGARPDLGTPETRALARTQESQEQLFQIFAAQMLASPISARVGSVFGTIPGARVSVLPILSTDSSQLTPTARITYGQRISSKLYLTYSSTLSAGQYDLILLEYAQSDRVSWVLSRNEDRTFALDFRLRYVF